MIFQGILLHPTILSFMREENQACDLSEEAVNARLSSLGQDKIAICAKEGVLHIWFDREASCEELARKTGAELSRLQGSLTPESVGEITSRVTMFIDRVKKTGRI